MNVKFSNKCFKNMQIQYAICNRIKEEEMLSISWFIQRRYRSSERKEECYLRMNWRGRRKKHQGLF